MKLNIVTRIAQISDVKAMLTLMEQLGYISDGPRAKIFFRKEI